MLSVDIPTRGEIKSLAAVVDNWCVSIYTPTESETANPDQNRIAFSDQARRVLDLVTDSDARTAFQSERTRIQRDQISGTASPVTIRNQASIGRPSFQ